MTVIADTPAGTPPEASWGQDVTDVLNAQQRVQDIMLSADVTSNSGTESDIAEFVWPVVNGRQYVFRVDGTYEAANTAQGLGIGLRHPGGFAVAMWRVFGVTSSTVEDITRNAIGSAASDGMTSGATVSSAASKLAFSGTIVYDCTADGNIQFRKRRNGANTTSPGVTIHKGASMLVHQSAIS